MKTKKIDIKTTTFRLCPQHWLSVYSRSHLFSLGLKFFLCNVRIKVYYLTKFWVYIRVENMKENYLYMWWYVCVSNHVSNHVYIHICVRILASYEKPNYRQVGRSRWWVRSSPTLTSSISSMQTPLSSFLHPRQLGSGNLLEMQILRPYPRLYWVKDCGGETQPSVLSLWPCWRFWNAPKGRTTASEYSQGRSIG